VRRRKIKNKNFKTLKNILINSSGIKKHAHHSSQVAVRMNCILYFFLKIQQKNECYEIDPCGFQIPDLSQPLIIYVLILVFSIYKA